jgi:hypothetical protein
MITITIQGYGNFQIHHEKLQELLNWISLNSGIKTQTNEQVRIPVEFRGKELING